MAALAFRPLLTKADLKPVKRSIGSQLKSLVNFGLFKKPVFLILSIMAMLATIGKWMQGEKIKLEIIIRKVIGYKVARIVTVFIN